MSTGRNDPCPCGSGKKFKVCCMDKIVPGPYKPWMQYPELYVIGDLLSKSKEFSGYYSDQRKKILDPVYWTKDPSLPSGINFRSCILFSKKTGQQQQYIRLRRVPAQINDKMYIAHELHHYVLDYEGFPRIQPVDMRYENYASGLASMLLDLVVDSRLKDYGFDIRSGYDYKVREYTKGFKHTPIESFNQLDLMMKIVYRTASELNWKMVSSEGETNKFHLWYDEEYPEIAKKAEELVNYVEKYNINNPDEMSEAFKGIIVKYNLNNVIQVAHFKKMPSHDL